jgi:ketosteroid isomerase-like protein
VSGGNVATVRRLFERWNAGNHVIPAEVLDPAVELESPLSSVSGEPYRGHAGIEDWVRDLDEQFAEWRLRLDEVREIGNVVLAVGGIHLLGRGSGVALDQPAAWVANFGTDHRITRFRIYLDPGAALKAVGLGE